MTQPGSNNSSRTILLFLLVVPLIGYLLYFAYKKNTESGERTERCQEECSTQGYSGYDFKWTVLSAPECKCLGEIVPGNSVPSTNLQP